MSSVFFQDHVLVISAVMLKRFQCLTHNFPKVGIWTGKVFQSHLNINFNKQSADNYFYLCWCRKEQVNICNVCEEECRAGSWVCGRLANIKAGVTRSSNTAPAAAANLNTWNASRDHPSPLQVKVGKHLLSSAPRLLLSNRLGINVYNDSESMGLFKHFREPLATNN